MNFISKVKAQIVDAVASPTIPFDPPTGPSRPPTYTVTPTVSGPSISLSTDVTEIGQNQRFTVEIKVNTDGQEVSSYQFLISYDTSLLTVVDFNPDTPTKEIEFLDTFFLPTEQNVDESTSAGTVKIDATSTGGTTTISNSTVARIEFETVGEGFANIKIIKDSSALINSNNTDILGSVNDLDITISSSFVFNPSPTTIGIVFPTKTPDTGILDTLGTRSSMIAGAILISAGFFILRHINNAKNRR